MKLAHIPLHNIVPGDRVLSHTGMSGRVGAVYRAGDPAPLSTEKDGSIDEPRILILWGNGKWTITEHHLLEKVSHDVETPRDALIHGVRPVAKKISPRNRRLADGFRQILADMGPERGRAAPSIRKTA